MFTIGIPTYKRSGIINAVLANLLGMYRTKEFNLIVADTVGVDDTSLDITSEKIIKSLELEGCSVSILSTTKHLITKKMLIRDHASSDIILFLDDDVVLSHDYFELTNYFIDEAVGSVAGLFIPPINSRGYYDWGLDPIPRESIKGRCNIVCYDASTKSLWFDNMWQMKCHERPAKAVDAEWLIGGAVFVRKSLFVPDPIFDEQKMYSEDFDYSYAIFRRGYRLILDMNYSSYHLAANFGGYEDDKIFEIGNLKGLSYSSKKYNIGEVLRVGRPK